MSPDEVLLKMEFPSESGVQVSGVEASWDAVTANPEGAAISLLVDCSRPPFPEPMGNLRLEITGMVQQEPEGLWTSWSSETDELESDLGKTLQLRQFIDTVRLKPDRYRFTCDPVLRGISK